MLGLMVSLSIAAIDDKIGLHRSQPELWADKEVSIKTTHHPFLTLMLLVANLSGHNILIQCQGIYIGGYKVQS